MKVKAPALALLIVVFFAVPVIAAKITGYWRTESSKVPVVIADGEFAGQSDPSDIRGSYTFGDIDTAFDVGPDILAEAFGFDDAEEPGLVKAKEIEEKFGETTDGFEIGTDSVRLFVALWTGLPHEPEETTVLPESAVRLLTDAGKSVPDAAGVAVGVEPVAELGSEPTPVETAVVEKPDDHVVPDRMVRGKTTFGELRSWGVTEEAWTALTGKEMGNPGLSLKDWATAEGESMSTWKPRIQELVDAAP